MIITWKDPDPDCVYNFFLAVAVRLALALVPSRDEKPFVLFNRKSKNKIKWEWEGKSRMTPTHIRMYSFSVSVRNSILLILTKSYLNLRIFPKSKLNCVVVVPELLSILAWNTITQTRGKSQRGMLIFKFCSKKSKVWKNCFSDFFWELFPSWKVNILYVLDRTWLKMWLVFYAKEKAQSRD